MAERFYVNQSLGPGPVLLEGPEAHHLRTVARLRVGDTTVLFNGDARQYPARVTSLDRRGVALEVVGVESPARELSYRLEVAAPLPKGDRAQFLVEKLTELGVTSFVPLATQRSVVHPRDAKLERLGRWVIEASKQCGRNVLMQLGPLTPWSDYFRRPDLPSRRLLGSPTGPAFTPDKPIDTAVAVGPEGGFSPQEEAEARAVGWSAVSLGPRVLRVETAALALAVLTTGWSPG